MKRLINTGTTAYNISKKLLTVGLLATAFSLVACKSDTDTGAGSAENSVKPAVPVSGDHAQTIETLKSKLKTLFPNSAEVKIKPTPVAGLYEVLQGNELMHISADGRFIVDGDMWDMNVRKNISENSRSSIRLKALDQLGEENMLVYNPQGEVKHTITVFTDIYCPYCQRLHAEMDDYMKNGIKVRYIFVPFKGKRSINASVSVWCADDRNKAMDLAKAGESIETKTCDNPVRKHQVLASELGIRGTPAIMLESGELKPGYVPSQRLIPEVNAAL